MADSLNIAKEIFESDDEELSNQESNTRRETMADSLNIAKEIFESDDFDSALRELYADAWSDSNGAVCYVLSIAPDNGGGFEFAVVADSAMMRNGDPVETGEITTILRVPAAGDDACDACEIED